MTINTPPNNTKSSASKQRKLFPVWLLRSKVSPTRQRVDLLERRSHTLKLHQSLGATLSLIHAPAGFGKSTILSNWRELLLEEGHRVCWLSLGKQDNDPLQLLNYIAFSLSEGGVYFETGDMGSDFQFSDLSTRDLLSLIIHFIAEQDDRVILILDDFENLEADVVKDVINPLLEYAPDNLHIAIATRDDSELKISNLEAKGRAVRFGAHQLKFTPIELNDFLGDELESNVIQRLFKLTEGWPVAIQMIRSAIVVDGDVERIMGDLTSDGIHIASYLSEEVISQLERDLQDFLMDIALVDRVDCDFADYLREEQNSYANFSKTRTLDTLVLPVDSVENTYRLHPLFREHLYERLSVSNPARLKTLHLRAADWFSEKGDLVEAVRQCVMAGEPRHSIGAVAQVGGVMIWFREGLTRLRAITHLLDEETIVSEPRLAMIRCLLDIKDGKVNQARQLYDEVTSQCKFDVNDLTQPGATSGIHEFVVMEIIISVYEGKPITRSLCAQLEARVETLAEADYSLKSNLLTILCIGNLQRGEFAAARKFGELAIPAFVDSGSIYGVAYIHFHLGDISFAEGDSISAATSYKKGLDLTKKHFNDDPGMKLVANVLISELNHELNETRNVSAMVRSIPRQLEKQEAWFDIYAAGYTSSAHREFDENGLDAALSIVDRGVAYAELNKLFRLTKFLACLRMDLLLRANRNTEARAVLDKSGLDLDEYLSESEDLIAWRERDSAVHAITRLLIREGEQQRALDLLAHFSRQARANDHVRARMIYKILEAIAHHKNSAIDEQDKSLEAALDLYAQSRFIRSFLNEKEVLTPILEQYLARQPDHEEESANTQNARTILNQFKDRSDDDPDQPLLSLRENEVLQQLIKGHSNKVIARRIDVSESTVRFHLRNIFVKLKVSSRLQAVTVAKQLRLV